MTGVARWTNHRQQTEACAIDTVCQLSAPHLGEEMVHDVGSNVVLDIVEYTVIVVTGG